MTGPLSETLERPCTETLPAAPDDRARVIVVDDEDRVRGALVVLLEHHGSFEVVGQADDGDAVPALIRQLEPDLVVLDLRMRTVGGIEALHLISTLDVFAQVVVLSAYSDQALINDALAAGAFDYLVKGCPADLLFSTLERAWCHARRARAERDA